jgi:hypothetical protein
MTACGLSLDVGGVHGPSEKPSNGNTAKTTSHVMKTKSIATLLTAALTIVFANAASASPPGKGTTLKKTDAPKVERKVEHNSMHRVGPPGKGYICRS